MGSENGSDSADSTPPPPPLKWIQYGSESQQEARQGTDTRHQYDGSVGKPREMSVFWSVYIWASCNGFARFSEKCYHKYLCNRIADCVLALSFLKVAHRISAIHDKGLFFNDLLTCCSRLRSLTQFCWRSSLTWLPGGHFHPRGSKTRIPNAELAPQKKMGYIMFCLGWYSKQYQGQKVLLKKWGCLFLERHCFNNFV